VRELGALVRDADGRALVAAGAIQDITERRRVEDALRESTRRLESALSLNRLIMANSQDAICVFDSEGRFTAVSAASLALWGYSPEELIGHAFMDFVVAEDRDATLAANAGLLSGKPLRDFRNRYLTKDGRVVVVQWSSVFSQADGLSVSVARDVTELQRRDAELIELRDTLVRAQQIAGMGSWELLIEDRRLIWSEEVYRIFGMAAEDFAGTFDAFIARIHPHDREALLRAQASAEAGGDELDLEHRVVLSDGSIRHVHERARLLRDAEGRPWRLAGSVQDITARKRAEQFERGQREILAGIAARVPLSDSLLAIATLCEQQHPRGLCSILLLDDAGSRLLTGAAPSLPAAYSEAIHGRQIGPAAGSCGTAAWRGERVVVSDIASDPLWHEHADLAQSHGLRACWSTPVKSSEGRVLATFAVYYREPGAPSEAELTSVEGMAAMAAVAIEQGRAYARLADSEQRFRSLFAEHPDAVFAMDLAGRFTACNQGFERITRVPADRSIGQFFDQGIAPRQRTQVRAHFTAAARGEARSYETQAMFPDGRQFDLRVTNLPIVIGGRVTGVFGIAHDISLLRQRERDLAAALARAQTGSEQLRRLSSAAMVMSQSVAGADLYQQLVDELRETVQAHQAVIMLAEPATGGKATFAVSLSQKYAAYRENAAVSQGSAIYAAVVAGNQPLRLTQEELEAYPGWREFGSEASREPPMRGWLAVPLIGSDGRNLGVLQLSDKAAGEFNEDDESIAVQFAQMASTAIERRALITRLSDNEERLRAIMQTAAEGILTIDEAGIIESANPETTRIFGYSEDELLGRNVRMLMPEPFQSEHDGYLARYVSTGQAKIIGVGREVVGRRRDGSVFPIDLSVSELKLADRRRFSGFVRDITERRRTARALQQAFDDLRLRNRELQDFAFVASHDLQEPLRKIRAFTDRVQTRCAEQLDETAQDYLTRASQAAARMQVLIDDLLTLSRVSSRGKPFEAVDLNALAATVLEDLDTRLEASGGRVELSELPTLHCDATQLRQLLQNLIANALKFRSPLRAPEVRVSARPARLDSERPGWEIRVCDNGIGFDPKYAERIFAPFQRLHGRQEYEGTGIGLAIVRRIVERHRGSIHAEGRPDQGACFVVLLPAEQPDKEEAGAEPTPQPAAD
jgi:PAS domain S-box-containing protein